MPGKRAAATKAADKIKEEDLEVIEDDDDFEPADNKKKGGKVKKEEKESDDDSGDDFTQEDEEDEAPAKKKKKQTPAKPAAKKSSGPPLRNDKNKMAYPKGTYVLRISDQDPDDKGEPNRNQLHVWRIDNHQLLQKYERVQAEDDKKYKKTCRYAGWQCEEGWKFIELRVKSKTQGEEDIVLKAYPTKEEIEEGQKKCKAKAAEDEEDD